MFSRQIAPQVEMRLSLPQYADEVFKLIDANREFLSQWLPWLDGTTSADDVRSFIREQLHRFARGEALHVTIFVDNLVAGVAGFNQIDTANETGHIGYWLADAYNGRGIMTQVVSDLIVIARCELDLQNVEIRCATDNKKSRAIPERLGFTHEGTLRRAEKVCGQWLDHEMYVLSLTDRKQDMIVDL